MTRRTTYWLVCDTGSGLGEESIGFRNAEARDRFVAAATRSPGFREVARGETVTTKDGTTTTGVMIA